MEQKPAVPRWIALKRSSMIVYLSEEQCERQLTLEAI
jgi:hypothetical protein